MTKFPTKPPAQNYPEAIVKLSVFVDGGVDLDKWAERIGVPPRRRVDDGGPSFRDALTGNLMETDASLRERILARMLPNPQLEVYAHGALHDRARYVVDAWQTTRKLTLLSPQACSALVELIYKELVEARKL